MNFVEGKSVVLQWVSEWQTKWERWRELGGKDITRTHIKHVEGYPPGIEIEFVSLGFHLNKNEPNGLEFNITELEP